MSTNDILVHLRGTVAATLLSIAMMTFLYRFENFSKGVFVIDWLLTTGLLLGSRGSFRFFVDSLMRNSLVGEKVLIYGAGKGGELLLREILNNHQLNVKPVGFVDDDPLKKGKKLHGYPIFGGLEEVDAIARRHRLQGLFVAFRSEDADALARTAAFCRDRNLF